MPYPLFKHNIRKLTDTRMLMVRFPLSTKSTKTFKSHILRRKMKSLLISVKYCITITQNESHYKPLLSNFLTL